MRYYDIGLGAERHWSNSVFTYNSEAPLSIGNLVTVPFGKNKKIGVVLNEVKTPTFKTKSIINSVPISFSKAHIDFLVWYEHFYANRSGLLFNQFIPNYLTKNIKTVSYETPKNIERPQLSKEQSSCLKQIENTKKPSILHGITGSGKTRIYIQLLINCLSRGKNGLLLFPEISLSSQLHKELKQYLPVITFHSELSDSERSKLWQTVALQEKPVVVMGPRSALFLPYLHNLGTIIIDEAHEPSFKQETDIHYNSIYVAGGLARAHGAKLVLGSATPPINETEQIIRRGGNIVCLHKKAITTPHEADTFIVDIRKRDNFTRNNILSDKLINHIEKTLKDKSQALLFINRRGTAKIVLCENISCDWQAQCQRCDLPLTYHHDTHKLICHTCGYTTKMTTTCPNCQSNIVQRSLGSKAIVDDISKLFPGANIARFDSDTDKKDSYFSRHEEVIAGKVDILIGTQQIIKGLDLPKLGLVGIVNADLSLHFPDYSSEERTFQIINQAIGRVNRGHQKSTVIIQTIEPNSPIIHYAINSEWHDFRNKELENRKIHQFPPFTHYAKLIFRDRVKSKALAKAENTKNLIKKANNISVHGPIESFYSKRSGYYFYQIICSSINRNWILKSLAGLEDKAIIDIDPINLL